MRVDLEIPLALPSAANLREHWGAKARRVARERKIASVLARSRTSWALVTAVRTAGATISLTRVSPRRLDDDNLASAFKPVRDGIADALRIDDGSILLHWHYAQESGPAAVRVVIDVPEGG